MGIPMLDLIASPTASSAQNAGQQAQGNQLLLIVTAAVALVAVAAILLVRLTRRHHSVNPAVKTGSPKDGGQP